MIYINYLRVVQAIAAEGIPWRGTTEVDSRGQKVNITAECSNWEAQETMDHKVAE